MPTLLKKASKRRPRRRRREALHRLIENDLIRRVSADEYRNKVKRVYGGPKGALLAACSMLSLHLPLGERIFRSRKFDLRGMRSMLDVGSGAGQIARHLLKYADPGAQVTCIDLSHQMLRRARNRLKNLGAYRKISLAASSGPKGQHDQAVLRRSVNPNFVTADLSRLPFADGSFDCITCGYVLEHLPDPQTGLEEIARVLTKGGRMFLLTTEDNFSGAWNSRLWCCRTYNRKELIGLCEDLGLRCKQEIWFTKMHRAIRAGGICLEIEKV